MIRTIIFLIFIFSSFNSIATNYYVSYTIGNDQNSGFSKDAPWKTISKVNNHSFSPGDSILFKKGDVWRESLIVSTSGEQNRYIVYSSYGLGDKPKILGSIRAENWTEISPNIWQSNTYFTNPRSPSNKSEIWFINQDQTVSWGVFRSNIESLQQEFQWTWNSNNVFIYSPSLPDTRYKSVEVPEHNDAIHLNGKQFIEINGIDMFFLRNSGVNERYPTGNLSGYVLRNCHIAYISAKNEAGYGSHVMYNNSLIENNIIHDCGRRGISLNLYGSADINNIIVQNNTFFNGWHTTGVDLSSGAITEATGKINNVVIRNNLFYDDPNVNSYSHQIFLQRYSRGGNTTTNIHIYNNIFMTPSGSAIQVENIDESYIYNNTFYGMNQVQKSNVFHIFYSIGSSKAILKNNIFYHNGNPSVNSTAICIYLSNGIDFKKIDADHNLYYTEYPLARIIRDGTTNKNYTPSQWIFIKNEMGWESNSPVPAHPNFLSDKNLRLDSFSPAIGAGINLGLVKDYDDNFYNSPPSIGAFEGNPPINSDKTNSTIILYPNPSNGFLTLAREGPDLEKLNFKIADLSGKVVFEGIIEEGIQTKQLHVNLKTGTYIVHIYYNQALIFSKMIVFLSS